MLLECPAPNKSRKTKNMRFRRRCIPAVALLGASLCVATPAMSQTTTSVGHTKAEPPPLEVLGLPPGSFELAVINLIASPTPPASLRFAVKTERFRAPGGWYLPVALAVEAADLTPTVDASAALDFHVDVVALVRDPNGLIVAKVSSSVLLRSTKEKLGTFRAERIPITCFSSRQVLPPGPYVLQVGVYDPASKRGGVVSRRITLPATGGSPALSSLVLASRTEAPAPDGRGQLNPFSVEGTSVVPDATGRFSKSSGGQMIPYFKIYGAPGESYQTRVVFMQGDRMVSSTPLVAPAPVGASGETSVASVVSLSGFEPGPYRAVLQVFAPGSTSLVASAVTPFVVDP